MNDEALSKEERQKILDEMDLQPVAAEISRRLMLTITIDVVRKEIRLDRHGYPRLLFKTKPIVNHLAKVMFKNLVVSNFGGDFAEDGKSYWMPIHFSWVHHGGGTNGCDFFTANYDINSKKWTFKEG